MSKPKIFLSYSIKDANWARPFSEALSAQGVDVWFDESQVPAGKPWQEAVERALRDCDFIVTLITSDSVGSPNLFFELGAAVGMGKTIIPVVPKEMDLALLPPPLRQRQVLVKSTPKETARLLASQLKLQAA